MPAKKTVKKSARKEEKSFEETLWETANKLRGSVESSEYKHVVLSLIFLKFVSDKFEERRAELVAEGKEGYLDIVDWSGATETTRQGCPQGERGGAHQFYTMQNVFYLPETSRWSYIQQQAKQGDTTQIPVCLWFLTKNKKGRDGSPSRPSYRNREGETLFIDVRKIGSMISRTQKEIDEDDIHTITDQIV